MARLLSYKRKDENRYSTFSNVSFGASTDNLTIFKTVPKAKMSANISPVHKKATKQKGSDESAQSRKRITCCLCCRWWCGKLLCFRCKRKDSECLDNEDDIDSVVERYRKQHGSVIESGSQGSTLKSDQSHGYWRWDESWKSNSDKFLESLEFDSVGSDRSLKRAVDRLRMRNSKVRKAAFYGNNNFYGGGSFSLIFISSRFECS
jgi:hypothetical protein